MLSWILLAAITASGSEQALPDYSQSRVAAVQKLQAIFTGLRTSDARRELLSQQLTETMMSLARDDRKPKRSDVSALSAGLVSALPAIRHDTKREAVLSQCIADLMLRDHPSNSTLGDRLRGTLQGLGLSEKRIYPILRAFSAIGEAVRGPDDLAVRPLEGPKKRP